MFCASFSRNCDINLKQSCKRRSAASNTRSQRSNHTKLSLLTRQIIIAGFKVKQINFALSHHHKRSRNLLSLKPLKRKYAATKRKKTSTIRIKRPKRQIKWWLFFLLPLFVQSKCAFYCHFYCLRNNCSTSATKTHIPLGALLSSRMSSQTS